MRHPWSLKRQLALRLTVVLVLGIIGSSAAILIVVLSVLASVEEGSLGEPAHGVILDLIGFSLLAVMPVLALTLLVTMWTLNRGFHNLDRVAVEARTIVPGCPAMRLSAQGHPDEILPLVEAMNDAIARFERVHEAERRFTADAAHELRTSIAVLAARIDTLTSGAGRDALGRDAARLGRLVSQMLRVARLDAAPPCMNAVVDLVVTVRETVAALAPLAIRNGRLIEMRAPNRPVEVSGNVEVLGLAVANLIENALMHTPDRSPIAIEVTEEPEIRVMDRGADIAPADRARIFQRFQRGSASTTSGAGLGLAIVAEIAALHGAVAAVVPREGGGNVFVISWKGAAGAGGVSQHVDTDISGVGPPIGGTGASGVSIAPR
ncbi:sensor histidine kinase [Ancylobacter defluvii]|nr:ATP-binding protein [Ancylobacter defluvii]